jgi:hypothetical protein
VVRDVSEGSNRMDDETTTLTTTTTETGATNLVTNADLARILADCERCPFDYDSDAAEARVWRDLHRVAVALRELRRRAGPLSSAQARALTSLREFTDGESPMHRAGVVEIRGMVARGPTIASLVRRGLAVCGGTCAEVDGDGCIARNDAPWYAITAEGRAALALAAEDGAR